MVEKVRELITNRELVGKSLEELIALIARENNWIPDNKERPNTLRVYMCKGDQEIIIGFTGDRENKKPPVWMKLSQQKRSLTNMRRDIWILETNTNNKQEKTDVELEKCILGVAIEILKKLGKSNEPVRKLLCKSVLQQAADEMKLSEEEGVPVYNFPLSKRVLDTVRALPSWKDFRQTGKAHGVVGRIELLFSGLEKSMLGGKISEWPIIRSVRGKVEKMFAQKS